VLAALRARGGEAGADAFGGAVVGLQTECAEDSRDLLVGQADGVAVLVATGEHGRAGQNRAGVSEPVSASLRAGPSGHPSAGRRSDDATVPSTYY
jgi:hypothetical protein